MNTPKKTINVRVFEDSWLRAKAKLGNENKKNRTRKTMMEYVDERI